MFVFLVCWCFKSEIFFLSFVFNLYNNWSTFHSLMVNTCRCLLISSHKLQRTTVQQQQTTIDHVILSFKFAYLHFRSNWRCKTFWNDSSWSFFFFFSFKRPDISTVREDFLVTMYRKGPDFLVLKFNEKWISHDLWLWKFFPPKGQWHHRCAGPHLLCWTQCVWRDRAARVEAQRKEHLRHTGHEEGVCPPLRQLAFPSWYRGAVSCPAEGLQWGHPPTPAKGFWWKGAWGRWMFAPCTCDFVPFLYFPYTCSILPDIVFLSSTCSWSCVAWVKLTSMTGSPTHGSNIVRQTATLWSGFGKLWNHSMRSVELGCCSLLLDPPEFHCKASRLFKVSARKPFLIWALSCLLSVWILIHPGARFRVFGVFKVFKVGSCMSSNLCIPNVYR